MTHQHSKYVLVVCTLNIGDKVIIEGWGKGIDGVTRTIENITYWDVCESGFMVKATGMDNPVDSNWLTKTT